MKRSEKRFIVILVGLMLFCFLAIPSYAQAKSGQPYPGAGYPTQRPDDHWEFTIAPYAWLAGISGDITVRDRTTHVSVSFNDILNNLDFAGEVQIEARKGRWGIFFQPNYFKLTPTASLSKPAPSDLATGGTAVRDADVRLNSQTFFTEFGGFYRISECRPSSASKQWSGSIDVLAGGRYWYLQNHISLSLPEHGVTFRDTSYADVIDPIVGFRMLAYLAPKFFFTLRGDAGGFGVSSNSTHITWNGVGTIGYDISPCAALLAGYRYMYINYGTSGGAGVKLTVQGPVVGLAYTF